MSQTITQIVSRALRLLGVLDPRTDANSIELENGMLALNSMLANWSTRSNSIYAPTEVSFNTVDGTALYTIGAAGDVATTRPKKILLAWVRDTDNTDDPIEIMEMSNYTSIVDKTVEARPYQLYHERSYALGKIYLYPTPEQVYTIYLKLLSPFAVYTSITDSLALPLEYEEAVTYQLAARLAPEYQRPISQEVAMVAGSALKNIERLNSQPVPKIISDPFKQYHPANIYEG